MLLNPCLPSRVRTWSVVVDSARVTGLYNVGLSQGYRRNEELSDSYLQYVKTLFSVAVVSESLHPGCLCYFSVGTLP